MSRLRIPSPTTVTGMTQVAGMIGVAGAIAAGLVAYSGIFATAASDSGAAAGAGMEISAVEAGSPAVPQIQNEPYDGRFSFVRISYETGGGLRGFGRRGGRQAPWAHDYPRAERNFMQILIETTYIRPYMDGGRVFSTDDPEMTKYPLAYISEPGAWYPSDEEVLGLRNYLQKGGFLIADDFRGEDWYNFDAQMKRVIPGSQFEELDESHDIFDSFFRIENLAAILSPTFGTTPIYMGLHEENDPTNRLMVIANYNNDIGEYWEFSDVGWYPIDLSNEAYKLGVNYLIYSMTH